MRLAFGAARASKLEGSKRFSVRSAIWVLAANVLVIVAWIALPVTRITPHAIFSSWMVCLVVFFIVAAFDKRTILAGTSS